MISAVTHQSKALRTASGKSLLNVGGTLLRKPVLSTTLNANRGGGHVIRRRVCNWYNYLSCSRVRLFELTMDNYFEREGECMLGGLLVLPTEHR